MISTYFICTELSSVTIPNNMTSINDYTFYGCTGLTSITIPSSVTSIGHQAFKGCNKLESITLPDFMTYIQSYTFDGCPAKIYVNKGTYTLLALWNAGVTPYLIDTNRQLSEPYLSVSTTQTTANVTLYNTEEYTDFVYCKGYQGEDILENKTYTITDLNPEQKYDGYVTIYKAVNDKTVYSLIYKGFTTNKISPSLRYSTTASSISATGTYIKGDAEVVSQKISIGADNTSESRNLEAVGLDPGSSYTVKYQITLKNGKTYSAQQDISTAALIMETQQPKVINTGNVIVKANTNLCDMENNVGFEWRRTDWTDDFASNTGGAYLYDGEMEGYIRNMSTAYLWKYRAYYESKKGTRYYGDWVGIDPTNTSYFEPTVHTYDNVSVDGNTARVKGYAQRGTDNITEQGFVYWKNGAAAAKGNAMRTVSSVPGDAQTVTVKVSGSNPVIEATLYGLDYNPDYCYMAFVTTDEGTFYGEEQVFKTSDDPTGIFDVKQTILNGYILLGFMTLTAENCQRCDAVSI